MLPVEIDNVKIDIVFAGIEFEYNAIENARHYEFGGVKIRVCTIEDLIIQKSVSERQKDWMDIETIIEINNKIINWNYLLKNIKPLSVLLDKPQMFKKIKDMQE